MGGEDFVKPRSLRSLVFASEDLDNIALFELAVEITHLTVDLDADDVTTDFTVKTESKVEWKGTLRKINDVALGCIDKDFVGEEVKAELSKVDFFAFFELGCSILKLGDPEEVGGQMLDLALFVTFGELLFIVIEAGGETAFSVFVHLAGADLKLDNFLVLGNDSSVKGLVAVLLWLRDVILDASIHGCVKRMNETESEITASDVRNDNTKRSKVVNFTEVLVVFGKLFVK